MPTPQTLTRPSCTSAGAELFTIQSHQIGKYWPIILGFLLKIDDPEWTTDEVYEAIKDQDAQVWGVVKDHEVLGIWITKILNTRRHRYGLVWICAGDGLSIGLELFPHIESWFKELGCKYIEIQGRSGWKKIMPDYELKHIVLRKTL